jgi:hypothetical protein
MSRHPSGPCYLDVKLCTDRDLPLSLSVLALLDVEVCMWNASIEMYRVWTQCIMSGVSLCYYYFWFLIERSGGGYGSGGRESGTRGRIFPRGCLPNLQPSLVEMESVRQ